MNDTTTSPAKHPLVQSLLALEHGSGFSQFTGGFKAAWGAVKVLANNRELWKNVAIPAAINLLVFIATAALLVLNADWFMFDRPVAGPWYYYVLLVLWWVYRLILYPLLIVLAYFLSMMLASIFAGPFNDKLSEKAERVFMGVAPTPEAAGWKGLVVGGAKGVLMAAATTIPRVILVLGLGLIPGVGPILAAFVGGYFVAVEYCDYALERRGYGVHRKMRTIWKHRRMALGFGVGANLLLIIPILNFISMPIAVIGGTALAITIDRFELGGGALPPP